MKVSVFFIIVGFLSVIYILNDIRKGKLNIIDSMIWVFGSVVILILSIFPDIVAFFAGLVGIEYAPSLLFLAAIIVLLGVCFKQVKQISKQEARIIDLAQNVALLKSRINELENKIEK